LATIQFENVSFENRVHHLTFDIAKGETVVLLGESGSGKTTTLKLVNRMLEPTSGKVLVDGQSTTDGDPIKLRRKIGYVIQEAGLFPHFTVAQNVGLVPRLERWEANRIRSRVEEVLTLVGLQPDTFLNRYPHELSGGQRQRVGVARALAADPKILLMDEPFGALDPITRSEIQKEFQQLQSQLRKTSLFVTHDVVEALLLGARIGVMFEGELKKIYTPGELLSSEDAYVRKFLRPLRDVKSML
jgi:osmoprotectant transport system ATP-binding protein